MTTSLWGNNLTEQHRTGPSFTLAYRVTEGKEFYQHDVWRSRNVGDLSPGVGEKNTIFLKNLHKNDVLFTIGKSKTGKHRQFQ